MKTKLFLIATALFLLACTSEKVASEKATPVKVNTVKETPKQDPIKPNGNTLATRFQPPNGFERIKATDNSFAHYLRNLPLKPAGTEVKFYDGSVKPNYDVYEAVIDLPIGKKDLHQCADAVMRLRAEYLWKQKKYDQIHFNFTNGFRVDYSEWMQGKRIACLLYTSDAADE